MTTVYPQTTKETNIKNKRTKNKKYIKVPLKIGLQYFFELCPHRTISSKKPRIM